MPATTTADMAAMNFKVEMMLADGVTAENGKLYILGGGWNGIISPEFPVQVPRVGLAVLITVPYTETNRTHAMKIVLNHEDGTQITLGPMSVDPENPSGPPLPSALMAQFNIGRPPNLLHGDSQNLPFAVNLDGLIFERPGSYSLTVAINDIEMTRLPFRVAAPMGFTLG